MDIQRIGEKMKLIERMCPGASGNKEKGAITIVETLIALSVGIAVLIIWSLQQGHRLQVDGARAAGRDIATFTRAASIWIAEAPPATAGNYGIADLQDCANPTGARFLPCAYSGNTTIRYATNDAGEPVNFANLAIEVTLPPAGPTGRIDFGVFRHGEDANDDGLSDSRPDLAAIALQHASEETAPGVFGYFALQFAREDPTGLVTDPADPSFDLAEVENIARIQAQVGAHPAAAPFLRVDGSNQMHNGITFVNGVQLAMNDDRLDIDAPGGITFETDVLVENLSATEINATTLETQTATVSDELQVVAADGATGAGFDRLDQSADIVRIDGDVVRLSQGIDANRIAIDLNTTAIASNAADMAALQIDVQDNRNQINTNTHSILTNTQNLYDLGVEVGLMKTGMEALTDVEVCTPLWSQVNTEIQGLGYRYISYCGNHCSGACPEADGNYKCYGPYSGNPVTYIVRNANTLKCETRRRSFYTSVYCDGPPDSVCK